MTIAMKLRCAFVGTCFVCAAAAPALRAHGSTSADPAAVRAAVEDYVLALYQVEPDRIERSVNARLSKTGYSRGNGAPAYREMDMTYDQLVALAERWNSNGNVDPKTAIRDIVVFDVLDQTASAKLTADWGVDYLLLGKYDGRWQIVKVLWQSPPIG